MLAIRLVRLLPEMTISHNEMGQGGVLPVVNKNNGISGNIGLVELENDTCCEVA